MVAQVNITTETDADFYQQFTYTLSDGVTPVNIVGATFSFGVRRSISDPNVLFRVTSTLGTVALNGTKFPNGQVIPIDGPNGVFALWITQQQLQAAPAGTWAQSLVITLPGGVPISPPVNLNQLVWTGALTINLGPGR